MTGGCVCDMMFIRFYRKEVVSVTYHVIKKGIFLSRPNRFIALVEIDGKEEVCHVKNTGRCRELLISGATVYVEVANNPERKTKYDLIVVQKGERLINMDSQAPNRAFLEWAPKFFGEDAKIIPEKTYGKSRFDFYVETADGKQSFVEVKGVTLEQNGVVMFPDAPTERGVKHIEELCRCAEDGYGAYLFFVVQMKGVTHFIPNEETHPEFACALKEAKKRGVSVYALDCEVSPEKMVISEFVKVVL